MLLVDHIIRHSLKKALCGQRVRELVSATDEFVKF